MSQVELSDVHRTAFSAAALRAAHALRGAEPKIFDDDLAHPLTDMSEDEILTFAARVPAHAASSCVLRSRFTEDRLAAARARLDQYVVLGAGLDSYALRMGDKLGDLIVYEVDDPPFQAWKRQRIEKLGLKVPSQMRFVPCDFETTSVAQALAGAGFATDRPCFMSWLGVTQYLTREATRETLRWAASQAAGSEIALNFLEPNDPFEAQRRAATRGTGIEDLTFYTVAEMTALLEEVGFKKIDHLSREAADEIYFHDRTDGMKAPLSQHLLSASV